MGSRGPIPSTPEELAARGSRYRGPSVSGGSLPSPPVQPPHRPRGLSAEERRVWGETIKRLDALGVLSRADGATLRRYCEISVLRQRCVEFIRKNGFSYEIQTPRGTFVRPYPEVQLEAAYSRQLLLIEQQFGLTPAARSRVRVGSPRRPVDPRSRYFSPPPGDGSVG